MPTRKPVNLYTPIRKHSIPMLYEDVPSFLRSNIVRETKLKDYDFVVTGIPWEGKLTWGTYSSCELFPRVIRQVSARYGGYIPELGINIFDFVSLCDFGDVDIRWGDTNETFKRIYARIKKILEAGCKPFSLGGDHSISIPIMRAFNDYSNEGIGVIHLDAHFDNIDEYDGDKFARCCPLRRISELENVNPRNIVHIGVRGPRNPQEAMEFAEQVGSTVYTILDIRRKNIKKIAQEAVEIASEGTEHLYLTVCMDVFDAAFAPGASIDPMGLSSYEVLQAVLEIGRADISGFDIVEVYPHRDINDMTSHLAVWVASYTLAGVALTRRNTR